MPLPEPATRAGRWLIDRSDWDSGLRAFRVRINATAGPDDMHRHVLAIEAEAAALDIKRLKTAIEYGLQRQFGTDSPDMASAAGSAVAEYARLTKEGT